MTHKTGKTISSILLVFSLLLAGASQLQAAGETMYDYTKIPPFIEVGLNPNLLMLIDNSASMYDPAYAPANDNYCYDNSYDPSVAYAGYFDSDDNYWYYFLGDMWAGDPSFVNYGFFPWGVDTNPNFCANWSWYASPATAIYGNSDLCLMLNETDPANKKVNLVFAQGRYLNWLMSSKFDVEKKILTGGKYDNAHGQLVAESRGCLEKRFIKKTPVTKGGVAFQATFGVRPPTPTEKATPLTGDTAYNGAVSTTRVDIFPITTNGFSFAQCQEAIDAWTDPAIGLGTLKLKTTGCLEAAGVSNITSSHTAFNHILQECWYYKDHGTFQPGAGTVSSLKNDCEKVYVTPPGAAPGADYVPPETLNGADVCYGQFNAAHPLNGPWGNGYVGQCWEPKSGAGFIWVDRPCNPLVDPSVVAATNPYCSPAAGDSYWYVCNDTYNANKMTCKSGNVVMPWVRQQVQQPVAGGITSVGWTDDADAGVAADNCVDASLRKYCQGLDEVTVVDSTEVSDPQGTAWGIPAVLVDTAVEAQLGRPMLTMKGLVRNWQQPSGLIQEFKYNLRMGAMEMNAGPVSECRPVLRADGTYKASLYDCLQDKGNSISAASLPDTTKINGGRILRTAAYPNAGYVDDGETHVDQLAEAINNINATAWTPLAEAYFEAVGYYAQKNSLRLNGNGAPGSNSDYICDQDFASYPAWARNTFYAANARVRYAWDYNVPADGIIDETKVYYAAAAGISSATAGTIKEDSGVRWVQFDPVVAGCQKNNILVVTDGGSTADLSSTMTNFVRSVGNHDGDTAVTYAAGHTETAEYECKTASGLSNLYGTTLMDDLSYYARNKTPASLFAYPTVADLAKQNITTYVVAAGTLQDDGTGYDCNPKTQLQQVAANSGTTLLESTDPSQLEDNLRRVFELIGGEPSSGSAASVISNSRSGEGAIFQAVFFPRLEDQTGREITWAGDVHALWLDELGNIREDCDASGCLAGDENFTLDKKFDRILQFYTDPVSDAARARAFSDLDGNGICDDTNGDGDKLCDAADQVEDNISLKNVRYLWSAGAWLSEVWWADGQRAYGDTVKQRHILTSIDGANMVDFTPAVVRGELVTDTAYQGYFHAATVDEADDIISYIRGNDWQWDEMWNFRGYRSRLIDWYGDGGVEVWKLGDIVNSTPTVVSTPAEDYDLVYGDNSYQDFRKRYRNRRAVVYAGGNDGGLHAFNGGYYNRATNTIDKAPPPDTIAGVTGPTKKEYDLGAELWMFVPKNVFPHLKWLTAANYSHVNYVDFKPYIFDAKIFTPDADHPQGWGTVLVGGMGFGGGNIGVDTNGDGTDDLTLRSSYFVLDITNPEVAPRILKEFNDPGLGYAIGSPTAIPLLLCTMKVDCPDNLAAATTWPMDWYLALPSGPHDAALPQAALNGKSDQFGKIFALPLGGTGYLGHLGYSGAALPGASTFTIPDLSFPNSFFTDVIAVDYDLDFKTDTLYFGSVANANHDETDLHTGGIHRLVIGEDSNPANWVMNTFYNIPGNRTVSGSPSVASDGRRAWVYFGTGRYYSAQLDKANNAQQSYFGLKERYNSLGVMDLTLPNAGNLVDVSKVWVEENSGILHTTKNVLFKPLTATDGTSLAATTFKALDLEISEKDVVGLDKYNGWKLDFGWKYDPTNASADADGWVRDLVGERNLGQAAILGNVVTFTTFVPSKDLCQPEGESFLWAVYYRTGTGYAKSVIGTTIQGAVKEVDRKVSVGVGLASTPNIHSGGEVGSTAFVQTSTGAIISVQQDNPGIVKSGMVSWREIGE